MASDILRAINPVAADLFDELRTVRRAGGALADQTVELCGVLDVLIERKLVRPHARNLVREYVEKARAATADFREVRY